MKVSIALTVFNSESYLEEQLDSYALQSRLPDELIVSDDGSIDSSIAIVKAFAARSPFPVHLHRNHSNVGLIANFDLAIQRCTGDIIVLSDHDDVWLPSKIEKLVNELNAFPDAGLVFSDAELVDEELRPIGKRLSERLYPPSEQIKGETDRWLDVLLNRNVVGGAMLAFRSEFIRCFSPIPVHLSLLHDGWIALVIASLSNMRYIKEPLLYYRQHGGQMTWAIYGPPMEPSQHQPVRGIKIDEYESRKLFETAISQLQVQIGDLTFLTERLGELASSGYGSRR